MAKLTLEFVKEKFAEAGYELLEDEYIDSGTKMRYRCPHHPELELSMCWDNFKQGYRCPACKGRYPYDKDSFNKRLKSMGIEMTCVEYNGVDHKSKFICDKCGAEKIVTPSSILKTKEPCRYCATKTRFYENENDVNNRIKELGIENIECVYYCGKNNSNESLFKCLKCGSVWNAQVGNVLGKNHRTGCPICRESKGEQRIKQVLDKYNIDYIRQYKFDDCKNKHRLPFDFCCIIDNKIYLIEYDGEQHFKAVNFRGTSDENAMRTHTGTVKNDKIKNEYCESHNIPLLRIPYYEFDNIESIVLTHLYKEKGGKKIGK